MMLSCCRRSVAGPLTDFYGCSTEFTLPAPLVVLATAVVEVYSAVMPAVVAVRATAPAAAADAAETAPCSPVP